ncbi:MAG: ATP-dependent Clp protease proteolytic subunit [Candidatus Sulfotelmatobacter sp.]
MFTADVQALQAAKLRNALTAASNAGHSVYLIISSGGGNVFEGLSIAAFMKTLPIQITTHNIGQTDSIANVIFAAGSARFANTHASFLFHGVSMHYEKQDLIEAQLQEQAQQIKRLRESIAIAFATYTGLPIADAQALMVSGATILSAAEALSKAVIHEIRDAAIPPGSQVVSIGNA